MEKSLTEGSIFKNIVRFSLPFLLSYFLQTLYGMADLFIVGQFNDADVITAVAVGSQLMHMLTVIIVGLAMGSTVLIGHAVGAKNGIRVQSLICTTVVLFAITAILFTAILTLACPAIVSVMSTPVESVGQTKAYLYICFAGIPFIVAYNIIASVYRGLGDSKSPMIFIAIACFINIILDYFFIRFLGIKASGAAIATIMAQAFSVLISLIFIVTKNQRKARSAANSDSASSNTIISAASGSKKFSFKLASKSCAAEILKIGVPVACQDGFIQISFLIITIIANRRGVDAAAAVGIVEKIISFLFLVPSSMLSSVSAIASQNLGAKKPERATKTLFYGICISFIFGMIFAAIFQFFGKQAVGLFTQNQTVQLMGYQYIRSYVFDCAFAAIHFCFSGFFCAMGKSIWSFVHNVCSIILFRIPGAYFASILFPQTLTPMGCAATAGSFFSSVMCAVIFICLMKKQKKNDSIYAE